MSPEVEQACTLLKDALSAAKNMGCLESTTRTGMRPPPSLPIGGQLREFYAAVDPHEVELPWVVEWCCLYSQRDLVECQVGYRYPAGDNDVLLEGWRPGWVVVGDVSGDPIIVDCATPACPVYMAVHGVGAWEPIQVSPSFSAFLKVLSAWLALWSKEGGRVRDGGGELRAEVVEEIRISVVGELPDRDQRNILTFMG